MGELSLRPDPALCLQNGFIDQAHSSSLLQSSVAKRSRKHVAEAVPDASLGNIPKRIELLHNSASEVERWYLQEVLYPEGVVSGESNLCINLPEDGEYLAPEFILLGCEKCASSTFASMFSKNPGVTLPFGVDPYTSQPNSTIKELSIFNFPDRFSLGIQFWLKHYPKCSRSKRMVATDSTPGYLYDPEVPGRMRMFYGEQSSKVKFGVILRDPLLRMHSAFWYYKNGLGRKLCAREEIDVSFQEYVVGVLAGRDPCGITFIGYYAQQLQRYMMLFSPSQFTIMLFKQIVEPATGGMTVINDLWENLGLHRGEPTVVEYHNTQEKPHQPALLGFLPHPALHEDVDANTLAQLQAHMLNSSKTVGAEHLADLFVSLEQKPTLARYSGPWDKTSIAEWIRANW